MRRLKLGMMSGGIPLDPDAVAFLTAAGITDATISAAINTLVIQLKSFGIWTKMKAIYPFVGGTATSHKFNLKNPADTNAAFRLLFVGGWTHSANGVQANAVNGYADTFLTPSVSLGLNSTHLSFYSRTNSPSASFADIGSLGTSSSWTLLEIFGNQLYSLINQNTLSNALATDSRGLFVASRTGANLVESHRNGSLISTFLTASNSLSDRSITISAMNNAPSPQYFSNRNYAFASIGDGLNTTEAANYYTAVQAFQTTLGRQV